jgi:DNA-binding LytR/AlgR family response regulator
VILEDQVSDRRTVEQLLALDSRFYLVGSFSTVKQLVDCQNGNTVHLIISDALIGKERFLNLLSQLPYRPEIIIVSAETQHAMSAIDQDVVHFIPKPIKSETLVVALERAYRKIQSNQSVNQFPFFFLQTGKNKFNKIAFDDLMLVEADGEYLKLYLTDNREVTVFKRLKSILLELPAFQFKQVHRSYIVNVSFIESISHNQIGLSNRKVINVGKTYKRSITDLLNSANNRG